MLKNIKKALIIITLATLILASMQGVSAIKHKSKLYAGQHIEIGIVECRYYGQDTDTLEITYITDGTWHLKSTKVHVGTSLDDFPLTKKGNPKVGHFDYKDKHKPMVDIFTVEIDLDDYFTDEPPYHGAGKLYIACHAVVQSDSGQEETAWANQGFSFPGNNWALYFTMTF